MNEMYLRQELKRLSDLVDALVVWETGWRDDQKNQREWSHSLIYDRRADLNKTEEIKKLRDHLAVLEGRGTINRQHSLPADDGL